ncbi:MAG: hypothetical protein HFI34_11125 [Lachnospiraceae bacterium]|nr:hypothetical protein [Lachnospiraceae bacterium]
MSFGNELKDNITGNVEHAVIIIEDKRSNTAPGINGVSASGLQQEVKKTFRVQFNPSSLSISTDRRKKDPKKDVSEKNMAADIDIMDFPSNTMSVKLIFDRVNNQDAFMNENLVLNPTSIAAQVTHAVKKEEFTVQPYVDGFTAAIRNPDTRKLTFQWGDFTFSGTLKSVSAVYTMFSISGRPVRAEVTLSVAANQADRDTIGYKKFDTRGLPEQSRSIQKVGNLLNLP